MAIDLGQGIQLDNLTVTPVFPGGNPAGAPVIPDPAFPDIKGTIRYASGPTIGARKVGEAAMGAKAHGVIKGGSGFAVGFKQVASFQFHTAFYVGIKDSDGCIEESSTGLNFRNFLDCSADQNLQSPWAPFYVPPDFPGNNKEFDVDMPDQPGGKLRLQRRNFVVANGKKNGDRLNFLVHFSTKCAFLTYFVVQKPDNTHLPIRGFTWTADQEIHVTWSKGQPAIQSNVGGARFGQVVDSLGKGEARFDILANKSLTTKDTILTHFNSAMFAAQAAAASQQPQANPDYSINEFAKYTSNITPEMLKRIENIGS